MFSVAGKLFNTNIFHVHIKPLKIRDHMWGRMYPSVCLISSGDMSITTHESRERIHFMTGKANAEFKTNTKIGNTIEAERPRSKHANK